MAITLLSALIIMAAYFLILYAGVAFIQDKRFFSSAPKENLAAIPEKKERRRAASSAAAVRIIAGWAGIAMGRLRNRQAQRRMPRKGRSCLMRTDNGGQHAF